MYFLKVPEIPGRLSAMSPSFPKEHFLFPRYNGTKQRFPTLREEWRAARKDQTKARSKLSGKTFNLQIYVQRWGTC